MLPSPPVSRAVLCFYPWVVILLETQLWEFTCMHSIKHSVIKRKILFNFVKLWEEFGQNYLLYNYVDCQLSWLHVFYHLHFIFTSQELMPYFQLCSCTIMTLDIFPWPLLQNGFWMQQSGVPFLSITRQMCVGGNLELTGHYLFMTGFSPNLWCLQLVMLILFEVIRHGTLSTLNI